MSTDKAPTPFKSFADFYPYYLSEHSNMRCRQLHYVGSTMVLFLVAYVIVTGHWSALWLAPLMGYSFAWFGHYFFEHNKPATFRHPFYSFLGDWVMFKDFLFSQLPDQQP